MLQRDKCKVIDCNESSSNGQEGYCPMHFDELEETRRKNKEYYDKKDGKK